MPHHQKADNMIQNTLRDTGCIHQFAHFLRAGMAKGLTLAVFALITMSISAQVSGDYRSQQSGDWGIPDTWEQWNGSQWVSQNTTYEPGEVAVPFETFPVVAATTSSAKTNTNNQAHVIALPSGIEAGDLLLIFWTDANNSGTQPTLNGWTQLASSNANTASVYRKIWYRIATGSEGSAVSTNSFGDRSTHVAYRIAKGTYTGTPFVSAAANGTNSSPDPANLNPGQGTKKFLWIASAHGSRTGTVTVPTGFSNAVDRASTTTSSNSETQCQVTTATRELETNQLNPGSFSRQRSSTHTAWTVAIQGTSGMQSFPHPLVGATAQGVSSSSNSTSHSVTIPGGDAGDMLVAIFSSDGSVTCSTTSSGWNKLGQDAYGSSTGNQNNKVTGAIFWKMASGTTPAADALTVTTSASRQSSHITYRIKGATGISGTATNGSSTNSNPPNHVAGEDSWLWIATRSGDGTAVATSAPNNYTDLISRGSSGANGATTNSAIRLFGSAQSSQDPGSFSSGNEQWVSWTLAIHGPAPVVVHTSIDPPAMGGGAPGYPEVAATATSAKTTTSGSNHTVSLPTGIQANDLLLIFWADANTSGTQPTTPSGWTTLYSGNWASSSIYYRAWYRIATGSESSTVTVSAGPERSAHTAYRIAAGTYKGIPVASAGNTGTTSSNPDPDNLVSGFGNTPTLWIASAHSTGTVWMTSPTNYGGIVNSSSGSAGVDHAYMSTATRELTASSENPGAFTMDADHSWGAFTVAIEGESLGTLAVVRNGHTVTVNDNTTIDLLTVASGGTVDIDGGTLMVNGNGLVVNGTITGQTDELILGGPDNRALDVSGAGHIDVYNVTANTSGGVTMNTSLDIRGTLLLSKGTFTANGNVKLVSTADGTGRLGPVAAAANYVGNLTVERYVPAGNTNWRLLGSAVAGQTVQNWKDDFYTAGFPGSHYPSFDSPWLSGNLWPSIRWYNEAVASADLNDGITGVSGTSQPLSVGQGFLVWSGDNLYTTSAFTVDVTGAPTLAKTPLALPMSRTNTGNSAADGWNLVSNPLPSPIDFTQLSRGFSVQNAYWIFDPMSGTHRAWSAGVGQGSVNGIIQSSQGFWMKANGNSYNVTVSESAKVNAPTGGTFGGAQQPTMPILALEIASGLNAFSDEATIVFANGTPDYDGNDALKFSFHTEGAPQIGVLSADGHELAIDFYGEYSTAIEIPLRVSVEQSGTYTITVTPTGINNLSCLTLLDQETGTATPLTEGASYNFHMEADAENIDDRFMITATRPMPIHVANALCDGLEGTASITTNQDPFQLVWADAVGNPLVSQGADDAQEGEFEFHAAAGEYIVYAGPAGECGQVAAQFTITQPEPLEADMDVQEASCVNTPDGRVELTVTGGTAPYTYAWSNGDDEATVDLAVGDYTVTITDANGCTLPLDVSVSADEYPEALFELGNPMAVAGMAMPFVNQSSEAEEYLWSFGDGNTSTEEAPEHTWATPGEYTVTLTATAGGCDDIFTMEVAVGINTAIATNDLDGTLRVWATPDHIVIQHPFGNAQVNVDVYDATGRQVINRNGISQPEQILLDNRKLSDGVWFVRITNGDVQHTFRLPLAR